MMAALTAAEDPNHHVVLLERQQRVGRKLLATGNGRCNLTNIGATAANYHGEQPDFVRLLMNMTLSRDERLGIADAALRGQVHPYVLNFIKILVERGAVSEFASCAEAYRDRYGKAHDIAEAEVTTATALSDEQREALKKRLEEMTGQQVRLKEHVRPEVVGGVLLELNGKRYDNTVRQRLDNIRRVISGKV